MKILMVCLGNICRSPLAEGILKSKAQESGLDWFIDSAGTGSWHVGEMPDPRSVQVAGHHNLDISNQRARQFKRSDFDNFDLILAMDQMNYGNIIRLANDNSHSEKVELIMNFVQPGQNISVPDPYFGNDGFEQVYQMLDIACDKIIEKYT